jgi:serine/threonine-protein kinase
MEGQKVGKYLIVAKIGSGAMGDVYRAHDAKLNRDVAVKTMAELYASDDQLVQRFQREAQSAAALNHPNVVTVFEFGSEQGKFYLAMELLDGADLKELIASRSLNDLWDKLDVMEQIAEGLAYAHKQGVVHRDLKPANIRVLPNGRVKIMDFGLARIGSSDMTRAGMVMGTPNYMSPEQVRGTKADARSDIFSLGAVFYELLSGKKAFNADSMHTILYKVLEEEPEPVRTYVPGLPAPFVAFIERCLAKDPANRYQDAGGMRDALRKVREALASGEYSLGGEAGTLADGVIDPSAPTVMAPGTVMAPHAAERAATSGAAALDLSRAATPAADTLKGNAKTLSGRSRTRMSPPAAAPMEEEARSRWPVYAGRGGGGPDARGGRGGCAQGPRHAGAHAPAGRCHGPGGRPQGGPGRQPGGAGARRPPEQGLQGRGRPCGTRARPGPVERGGAPGAGAGAADGGGAGGGGPGGAQGLRCRRHRPRDARAGARAGPRSAPSRGR